MAHRNEEKSCTEKELFMRIYVGGVGDVLATRKYKIIRWRNFPHPKPSILS